MVAGVLLVSACGSSSKGSGSTSAGGNGSSADLSSLKGTLNGSGSSFQQTFDEAAIAGFQEKASGVTINYAGGGSGKGKQDLADKVVDFAGTDSLVKPADESKYTGGGGILYFPTVAAPITISYKLSGVDNLKLDAATIAKIFQGDIKKWNDAAIKALNSGASLPSTDIVPVHRSDASGTTSNFSKYLDAAATGTWTLGASDTLTWPSGGQAGNGNSGVAQIVKSTDGAIGYVDLADATNSGLQTAQVKNKAGKFVAPTLDAAAAAVAGATVEANLTYSPLDAPGDAAYPLTSPTWIIVYKNQAKKDKGDAMKAFLNFVLTDGQALAKDAGYAKLPSALAQKAITQLGQLKIG
ncbi:MAG: phosphate transport system substrate-binding protein [Actinomycetota bacterium]|nr:phosphate transport system substrate-binding protein [Actinomycetota bacterium]